MDNEQGRYWHIVAFYQNMKNAGLTDDQIKNPQYVADFFLNTWKKNGKNRKGCITVCLSAKGEYHLHGALCGEKTSLNGVSKTMFNSHVEKCIGGKRILMEYIQKKGKYAEKGEVILAEVCDKDMLPKQGKRNDLKRYQEMIDEGYIPEEIFHEEIQSINVENAVLKWYAINKNREEPTCKSIYIEWHMGETGTGKSHYYEELREVYGADEIYYIGDLKNGWIDNYVEKGCPRILFLDDLAKPCEITDLLGVIDANSNKPIHGRYKNAYPRWEYVYITSLEPPEVLFAAIVHTPYYRKLLRKVDYYVYHFIKDYKICRYMLPSNEYKGYVDLQQKANSNQEYVKTQDVYIVDEPTTTDISNHDSNQQIIQDIQERQEYEEDKKQRN